MVSKKSASSKSGDPIQKKRSKNDKLPQDISSLYEELGQQDMGAYEIWLILHFYRTHDPLLAASEALRFQILDREIAMLSDDGSLGELGEDHLVDSDWDGEDLLEGASGYVVVLCRQDSMEEVLLALNELPVVIHGNLIVQDGEEETWEQICNQLCPDIQVSLRPSRNCSPH